VIADVDEVLRKLLIREMDIKRNEVEVVFDQPKREWSSRVSKPTLNLFLFDIRENLRLRAAEQYSTITRSDGFAEVRRNPVRMDLRYLMTAWVKDPEDEHLLLSSALMGLLRNPFLPADLIPDRLKAQPVPIPVDIANFPPEVGPVDKFSEIWGVLDNEMRPGILLTITLSVDPYKPMVFPSVRTREARVLQDTGFAQADKTASTKILDKTYWSVGGTIKSDKYDLSTLALILVENQTSLPLDAEGRFAIHNISEGEFHLDVLFNQKVLKRQIIKIPAPNYDIHV
jgi:hypothetical protein